MPKTIRCPDCGTLVAWNFSLHTCRPAQVDQGPEFAKLTHAVEMAERTVDQRRIILAEAEAELRKARAALSRFWRARGAKG